jgi:membrane associated rhomboid family serine protease
MFPSFPPATRALLIANAFVYLLELVASDRMFELLALWPIGPLFHPWQVVTYAFLHDRHDVLHIIFNLFALWMFGGMLETYLGRARFIIFYFACVLAAAGIELVVLSQSNAIQYVIGATGGIFGILLAYAWFFPRERLLVLPIPIPIPAWLLVTAYGAFELWGGVTGGQEGIVHFAPLGGMLGGAIMILLWRTLDRGPTHRTP